MSGELSWAARIRPGVIPRPEPGEYIGPRTKLMRAGQELLLERGDSSYTVEELVRRARVAIKTFYRCFPNKEEFLQTVFEETVSGRTPLVREQIFAASDDPLTRLRLAVTWPLVWDSDDEATSRVIANEHMRIAVTSPETIVATRRPYEDLIRDLISDAAAAGLVRPSNLSWDVHIITSIVTTSFHTLSRGLGEPDPVALADNVWRFCLTALNGPGPAAPGGSGT